MARFSSGWVKLYREDIEDLSQNIYLLSLWTWLVANANWKDSVLIHKGTRKVLPPGTVVIGIKQKAVLWRCNAMTLWRWMDYLVQGGYIVYETHTRGTIVTICNWGTLQGSEDQTYTPGILQVDSKYTPGILPVDAEYTPGRCEVELSKEEYNLEQKIKQEEPQKNLVGIQGEYTPEFDKIWIASGRRGDKKAAFKEFKVLKLKPEDIEKLTTAVGNYVRGQPDKKYRLHLNRFLKTDWKEHLIVDDPLNLDIVHPKTQERIDVYNRWLEKEKRKDAKEVPNAN